MLGEDDRGRHCPFENNVTDAVWHNSEKAQSGTNYIEIWEGVCMAVVPTIREPGFVMNRGIAPLLFE